MKRVVFLLAMTTLVSFGYVKAQDDVYYIPSKEVRVVKSDDGKVVNIEAGVSNKALNYMETRNVDDYNRHRSTSVDTAGSSVKEVESTFDDFKDEVSYPYTKIVMRFHSPHPGVIISSPYYWDICYGDVWDVYYDNWAWSSPSFTWWSCAYDPWYYDHWAYRTCWDYTWGWHDPWWSYSYWGWGRPIYWGWSRPAFNPHHIGRPMWDHRYDGFHGDFAFGHRVGRTFIPRDFGRHDIDYRGGVGGGRHFSGGRVGYDSPRITRAPGRGDGNRYDGGRYTPSNNNRAYGRGDNMSGQVRQPQRMEYNSQRGSSPSVGSGSRPMNGGGFGRGTSGGGGFSRGGAGGGGVSRGGGRR